MTNNKMNLDGMSAEELAALISDANAMLEKKREEGKTALIEEMNRRASALGLSLQELVSGQTAGKGRKPRSDAGKAREPKYRGPGGLTWSGKGRKPGWLTELEAQGKSKEDFAV